MMIIIIFITTKSSHSFGPKGFISRQGKDSPMNNIDLTCPKAPDQRYLFYMLLRYLLTTISYGEEGSGVEIGNWIGFA